MNNTRIFARLTASGTQYVAYQMNYESASENAMILPLPIRLPAREDSLRFVDLNAYENLFDDLGRGFPYREPIGIGCCSGHPKTTAALAVFEIGNYVASFVPTISDFERLDPRFRLPATIWDRLPEYKDFGFAVFQLAAGSLKPHPMAFEFETANKSIFFPTLHIHDGQIHETENFDHVLYLQHAGFDNQVYAYQNSNVKDKATRWIRSDRIAKQFCDIAKSAGLIEPELLIHRILILGKEPNQDTEIAAAGDPVHPTINLRGLWSYTPWLAFAGAVSWFFSRRATLKRKVASPK